MAEVRSQATLWCEARVDNLTRKKEDPVISIITVVFLLDEFESIYHTFVKVEVELTISGPSLLPLSAVLNCRAVFCRQAGVNTPAIINQGR